jgi:hypothetical protein
VEVLDLVCGLHLRRILGILGNGKTPSASDKVQANVSVNCLFSSDCGALLRLQTIDLDAARNYDLSHAVITHDIRFKRITAPALTARTRVC